MLTVKVKRVPSRQGYNQASYVIDTIDDKSPQGRSINDRQSVSWEGLHAYYEAIGRVLRRESDMAAEQEKRVGTHEFTEAERPWRGEV